MTDIYYYSPSASYLQAHQQAGPRFKDAVKSAASKRFLLLAWLTPYAVFLGLLVAHLLS
jgi:hypothetical protein